MARPTLSRRGLIGGAVAAGTAWIGRRAWGFGVLGPAQSPSAESALAELCADLRCSHRIAAACLAALPPHESKPEALTRLILEETGTGDAGKTSAAVLQRAVRKRSRDDFRDGRIVTVEGWMLSRTETRVYALSSLLAKPSVAARTRI